MCHGIIRGKGDVCDVCKKRLRYVQEPKCKKCGKEIEKPEQEYCSDCQRFAHAFDKGAAVFIYDEVMRKSISMFKYHNRREYAEFYAKEMTLHCQKFLEACSPEVILPVPVHRQKKRKRGFNQSELVAKKLGRILNIPVDAKYLVRAEKTMAQKELTRLQRKQNLKKAFTVSKTEKHYERVLVVDDIYTTGATMDAISEILRENQTKIIYFLTICVGRNH